MAIALADLRDLAGPGHVCWTVRDPDTYVAQAAEFLACAPSARQKPFAFGPEGSPALEALRPLVAAAADPRHAFLGGGPLEPDLMFAMFDEQSALARAEGFGGLRLVADMDWLLGADPTAEEVVAFELLLDREARRLDATIVCAYRDTAFDADTIAGVRCVHPIGVDDLEPPQFVLAATDGGWRLTGEVDLAVASTFGTAIATAVGAGSCTLDLSELRFIDVAGMRELAAAARDRAVTVVGAPPLLRRCWDAAGFAAVAPAVELVD